MTASAAQLRALHSCISAPVAPKSLLQRRSGQENQIVQLFASVVVRSCQRDSALARIAKLGNKIPPFHPQLCGRSAFRVLVNLCDSVSYCWFQAPSTSTKRESARSTPGACEGCEVFNVLETKHKSWSSRWQHSSVGRAIEIQLYKIKMSVVADRLQSDKTRISKTRSSSKEKKDHIPIQQV